MSDLHRGSCFCGRVTFEAAGPPALMAYCHCRDCRTWLAAPVNAFAMWTPENVRVTGGEDELGTFSRTKGTDRRFCKSCGGPVMTEMAGFGLTELFASLIEDLDFSPTMHVNYSERSLSIADGLPKFRDLPAEVGGSGEMLPE